MGFRREFVVKVWNFYYHRVHEIGEYGILFMGGGRWNPA